jgi:hypothetical protein
MTSIINSITVVVSLIVSGLALSISYKSFLRQKTFDNENYLFKYKIEKYNEVLACMVENVTYLKSALVEYYYKLNDSKLSEEYFEERQDAISDKIEETELVLVSKVVFVSEEVLDEIEKYIEFAYAANFVNSNMDEGYNESKIAENTKRDFDNVYKLENMIYDVADAMRADSGVEPLNVKLASRLDLKKHSNKPRVRK